MANDNPYSAKNRWGQDVCQLMRRWNAVYAAMNATPQYALGRAPTTLPAGILGPYQWGASARVTVVSGTVGVSGGVPSGTTVTQDPQTFSSTMSINQAHKNQTLTISADCTDEHSSATVALGWPPQDIVLSVTSTKEAPVPSRLILPENYYGSSIVDSEVGYISDSEPPSCRTSWCQEFQLHFGNATTSPTGVVTWTYPGQSIPHNSDEAMWYITRVNNKYWAWVPAVGPAPGGSWVLQESELSNEVMLVETYDPVINVESARVPFRDDAILLVWQPYYTPTWKGYYTDLDKSGSNIGKPSASIDPSDDTALDGFDPCPETVSQTFPPYQFQNPLSGPNVGLYTCNRLLRMASSSEYHEYREMYIFPYADNLFRLAMGDGSKYDFDMNEPDSPADSPQICCTITGGSKRSFDIDIGQVHEILTVLEAELGITPPAGDLP